MGFFDLFDLRTRQLLVWLPICAAIWATLAWLARFEDMALPFFIWALLTAYHTLIPLWVATERIAESGFGRLFFSIFLLVVAAAIVGVLTESWVAAIGVASIAGGVLLIILADVIEGAQR